MVLGLQYVIQERCGLERLDPMVVRTGWKTMAKVKPGPKVGDGGERDVPTTIRSTKAWKAWVASLATYDADARRSQTNVSDTVDRALVEYARSIGFPDAAPKR
jgi:hypothetical protein